MKNPLFLGLATGACLLAVSVPVPAATLDDVQNRSRLKCGLNARLTGFGAPDANGVWDGFDVGICRAVAAAVLGDPQAVEYVPTTPESRYAALASGEIDMLVRSSAWTFGNDAGREIDFAGVSYYDGQGFMAPKALAVASAKDLDGATVCVQTGSASELNLAKFFRLNNLEYSPVPVTGDAQAVEKYLAQECDVFTADTSALAATRAGFQAPGDHVLLPEIISKEPLGPAVREGDAQWADIVRWVLNALISAEELGITSANVTEMSAAPSANPEISRLLGTEDDFGAMLGLDRKWAVRAIVAGGNYGELFEKNIGESTPIGLARGLNAQWRDGGLLFSPPFR